MHIARYCLGVGILMLSIAFGNVEVLRADENPANAILSPLVDGETPEKTQYISEVAFPKSGFAYVVGYSHPRSISLYIPKTKQFVLVALSGLDVPTLNFTSEYYYSFLHEFLNNRRKHLKYTVVRRFALKKKNSPVASVKLFFSSNRSVNKIITKNAVIRDLLGHSTKIPVWKKQNAFYYHSPGWFHRGKNQKNRYPVGLGKKK